MTKTVRSSALVLLFVMIVAGMYIIMIEEAQAGAKIVQVEGAVFNVQHSISDNIAKFKGKHVQISLTSGEIIIGNVVDVSNAYLHLEKLERMDFYDALIKIDDISAVKAKFRKYDNK
jgi:small nuclear ribonucleoprotein (snRNP)-like protein